MRNLWVLYMMVFCWPGSVISQNKPNNLRQNVLFIAVDDLRPEFGAYGALHVQSPHLDKLASQSVLFEKAYCQQATCAPSRTSILTGKRPDETGVTNHVTHFRTKYPDLITLPQLFKNAGYVSFGVGKIFHFAAGYQDSVSWSEPTLYETNAKVERYARPENQVEGKGKSLEFSDLPDSDYSDGKIADAVIGKLRLLKESGEPFFIGAGFLKPHLPFCAPKTYWDLYQSVDVSLSNTDRQRPQDAPDLAFHKWQELRGYEDIPGKGDLRKGQEDSLRRAYYACVSFVDAQIGKVLDELEKLGLAEKTIVVLWGDHGYHLGEQDLWHKHTNFELDTHVPLLIKAPGFKPGRVTELAELLDIYPTLAQLTGLEPAQRLSGSSLVPVMTRDKKVAEKKAAFSQYFRPYGAINGKTPVAYMGYTIRTESYRYTAWFEPGSDQPAEEELYDMRNGVMESINLVKDKRFTPIASDLKLKVKSYKKGDYAKAY